VYLAFQWCQKGVPERYSKLLAGICKEVMIREKVALFVLDAKVVTVAGAVPNQL